MERTFFEGKKIAKKTYVTVPQNGWVNVTPTTGVNIPNEATLVMTRALEGRGQSGFAGFFGLGTSYLIKTDDAATCLMEGTAYFAQDLVPQRHGGAVNFARAGVVSVLNAGAVEKHDSLSVQLQVQPAVEGNKIKGLDEIVFKTKRVPRPWTLEHYEKAFARAREQAVNGLLTERAQWDFAVGLFISGVVGDESVHLGQFMAEVDFQGLCHRVTRIDFGARERFGAIRSSADDFKHTTSEAYVKSASILVKYSESIRGYIGKDALTLLLNSPAIWGKYITLWSRLPDGTGTDYAARNMRAVVEAALRLRVASATLESDVIKNCTHKGLEKNSIPKDNAAGILYGYTQKRIDSLIRAAKDDIRRVAETPVPESKLIAEWDKYARRREQEVAELYLGLYPVTAKEYALRLRLRRDALIAQTLIRARNSRKANKAVDMDQKEFTKAVEEAIDLAVQNARRPEPKDHVYLDELFAPEMSRQMSVAIFPYSQLVITAVHRILEQHWSTPSSHEMPTLQALTGPPEGATRARTVTKALLGLTPKKETYFPVGAPDNTASGARREIVDAKSEPLKIFATKGVNATNSGSTLLAGNKE